MSQLPHTNRKVQKKVGSRSGSFNVAPSPSKTVPAASSSLTSTSPFKVSDHRQNTEDFDTILNVEELTFEETHLSDFMGDLSAPSPSTLGQQSTFPPAVAKKTTASPANATPKPVGTSQTYKVKYVAPSFGSRKSKVSKAKEYPAAAPAFQTTPTEVMDMSAEKPTEKVLRPHAIYGDKNVATDEASGAPKDSHAEKYPAATTAERANIVEKSLPSIGVENYGLQKTSVSDATDEFPPTPPPSCYVRNENTGIYPRKRQLNSSTK
ncbi:hypothetical protein OUZ56_026391 [Daphnia magna]|uniref:Uncharacterized protein n=1 Tax=Daphnia magna TaxID=35525 RepID=A0ABQ9ZM18_9CRUS|nr:hypothetical protein OUZ56_026391 [Daphnia magna]